MAHLDEIIAINGTALGKLPRASTSNALARHALCVVTCVDPQLLGLLGPALGLDRGDAAVVCVPGASVLTGHGDALRAVASAVYVNGAEEVLVLGHTDCASIRLDASAITSAMQRQGVSPESMPGGVREFLGGLPDARQGTKSSAAAIRAAPFLPRDLLVHAAILDTSTGALEILERGENFQATSAPASSDTVGYRPGPAATLGSVLGDGAALLRSGMVGSTDALAGAADAFSTFKSELPPGWSDGASALASVAMPATSGNDLVAGFQAATALSMPAELLSPSMPGLAAAGANDVIGGMTAAVAAHGQPAPPPLPKKPARPRRPAASNRTSAKVQQEHDANFGKVRDFMRLELSPELRRETAKALARAGREGQPAATLAKLVIKPILDTGQKRYRIVDEVIALKEQASALDSQDALELLAQLFD